MYNKDTEKKGEVCVLIGIIFAVLLILFVGITKIKGRYTLGFVTAFFSVVLLLFSMMLYITKMTVYRYFFQIEFVIYRFISNIKISFYDIKWILIIAVVIFQLAMVLVTVRDVYTARQGFTRRYFVLYAVMSLVYIFINSTAVSEYIYIGVSKNLAYANILRRFIPLYGTVYMLIFSLCPYISIMQNYFSTVLLFKKRHLKAIFAAILLLQILYVFLIRFTPLKFFMDNTDIYDYTSINLIYDETLYIYVPVIIIASLIVASYVILRFNLPEEYLFLRRRKANQKFKILFGDMRHLFHSYKNVMLSIDFLQDKAMKNFGTEKCRKALCDIKSNIDTFSAQASKFFEIYNNNLELNLSSVCLDECMDFAVGRIDFSNIKVIKSYYDDMATVYGDFDYLQEMFYNLLANAKEVLETVPKDEKKIEIKIWFEKPWLCVSVKDNGTGIAKKDIDGIFKPFNSTKKSFKNWGLGLAYVKNVAEAHLGYIDVDSKLSEYTEFQIILPAD